MLYWQGWFSIFARGCHDRADMAATDRSRKSDALLFVIEVAAIENDKFAVGAVEGKVWALSAAM